MNYGHQTLREFLSGIASENVTPAGGTGAAVAGAIGASLCEMACIHTLGNDEYSDVEAEMIDVRDELEVQQGHLLELADRDAEVVNDLFASSGIAVDPTERKRSIGVPLTIAEACLTVIEQGIVVVERGNRTAAPDARTGIYLAHSALRASVFIVRSNQDRITDQSFIEEAERRTTVIEESAETAFERLPEDGAKNQQITD